MKSVNAACEVSMSNLLKWSKQVLSGSWNLGAALLPRPPVFHSQVCNQLIGKDYQNLLGFRQCSTVSQGTSTDREVRVTNFSKEDKGTAVLAGDIFDVPIRRDIVHRVVVWQLAKRRQGTHSTRTISEVSGTGKKPGPQKGSGRARHGTLRGPQFRGGANVFGPKPRNYELGLQKKVRRLGLKVALSARLAEGKLVVFDNITPPTAKTKDMVQLITAMETCKKVLFVEETEKVNDSLCRSTKNIHYANVLPVKGLNVYSILQHDTLVMTLSAIRTLEERLHTPINR